jgi:phosphate transport system substrate-binding protein
MLATSSLVVTPAGRARRRLLCFGMTLAALTAAQASTTQERLRISGTGSGTGGMQVLLDAFRAANPTALGEVLPAVGSSGGIRAVIDGKLEVAVSNRPPNDKELALAPLQSQAYGRTPFVLAVHKSLGVTQLSHEQVAALYAEGAATFPNGRRARPVLRLADATDTNIMKSISPAVASAIDAATGRRGMLDAATDSETADLIERTPGAFGPSTLALIQSEGRPLVAVALDGVQPTVANLASGKWRLMKPLYIITGPQSGPLAQRFVAFVRSAEGRRVLAAVGHAEP